MRADRPPSIAVVLGVIHAGLRDFAVARLGADGWDRVRADAGLPDAPLVTSVRYPDEQVPAVLIALSKRTATPLATVIGDFGEFLAPVLIRRYDAFVDPEWRTLDLVENVERVMHRAVRVNEPDAEPPRLTTRRSSDREVEVIYTSERRMCALAKGIVRGVAAHYGEEVSVTERTCVLVGDPRCEMVVTAEA